MAPDAWNYGHGTVPIDAAQIALNTELRAKAKLVIEALENGESPKSAKLKNSTKRLIREHKKWLIKFSLKPKNTLRKVKW